MAWGRALLGGIEDKRRSPFAKATEDRLLDPLRNSARWAGPRNFLKCAGLNCAYTGNQYVMAKLPNASNEWTVQEAAHLLNRAGFGGSPKEIRRFHGLGRRKAVESLLKPEEPIGAFPLPDWAQPGKALANAKSRLAKLRESREEMKGLSKDEAARKRRELGKQFQRDQRELGRKGQGWWFDRMLGGKAPLREKMTLFWHDHFATSIQKVKAPVLMMHQNQRFRRHATGSFKKLTHEILEDPAMMLYLDTPSSKKGKPNENFAREVMELFTLGVGNYSEQDIKEAARAFTGYTLNRGTGEVYHNKKQWDAGEKTLLGESGKFDGHDVVNVLFKQEAAARYVPTKLWEYFVYEQPSEETVDRLAEVFKKSEFVMEPLLREIFLSQEFYGEHAIRTQIKGPVQYLVQMLKQLEIGELPPGYALMAQAQLGQVLFLPPNVAGWDWGKAWINTNTLLTRYNVAGVVTKGAGGTKPEDAGAMRKMKNLRVPGGLAKAMARNFKGPDYAKVAPRSLRENPKKLVEALSFRFFQGPIPAKAKKDFELYAESKKGAIFTDKEVGELCHLMMSTPYYQLT